MAAVWVGSRETFRDVTAGAWERGFARALNKRRL